MEDLAASIMEERLRTALARAQSLESSDPAQAAASYEEAARHADKVAAYAKTPFTKSQAAERAHRCRERAQYVLNPPPKPQRQSATPNQPAEESLEFRANAERMIRTSTVQWNEIAGLQESKDAIIGTMRLFFMQKPEGVKLAPADKFLLYGPPGTGKTLLARAAAAANGMTFFNVGVNTDLLSKWVGDSPKILRAVYELAEERAPSIVFLDEVDQLVRRGNTDSQVTQQLNNTFLTLLDGFESKSKSRKVMTVATTNNPWDLTPAMRSRFQKQVYVPLPDEQARRQIIQLETKGHTLEFDLDDLVAATEGFSGRDLANLCNEAIHLMINQTNPMLTNPDAPMAQGVLQLAPLTEVVLKQALAAVRPATSEAEIAKYTEYTARGGRA